MLRETKPFYRLSEEERKKIAEALSEARKSIDNIEKALVRGEPVHGGSEELEIAGYIEVRDREESFINIHPIQAGGRLTSEAMKALIAYGDGYSTCDWCRKPFRLDKIQRPAIADFHRELADFIGMDEARVVPGARRGFQAVVSSIVERGDYVLVSAAAHYTEFLAVEDAGGIVSEVPLSDRGIVTGEAVADKIEKLKGETGKLPKLILMDHVDYMLGNVHDVRGIARVAKEYDVPFLCNCAYTMGVMPVNGKEIGADFLVGSGHKSFASPAPSGIVGATREWADKVFRTTQMAGDVTGRKFGIKEVEMLGCTLMGATLIAMMASFPIVRERVRKWDEEVRKSNYFVNQFLRIRGNKILSEMPRRHTLTKVDTTETFDKVAKTHKRKGFFLSDELKERKIVGEFFGATRQWKLNTYGLTWDQVKHLANAFIDIAMKYGLPVG